MSAVAHLVVVGAGPKGVAVAAKAAVLADLGLPAPRVTVVDPGGVAAHWSGGAGFTDGEQHLGTPPEKDVGFPYAPSWGAASAAVTHRMLGLSWAGWLTSTGEYAEWVDRGRPRPRHRRWAAYLQWVADSVGLRPVAARVGGLEVEDGAWRVDLDRGEPLRGVDGVVLTGPGRTHRVPGPPSLASDPRVLDGRTVWAELARLRRDPPAEVCVVGAGETAGATAVALLEALPGTRIEVVTPTGVLFTRGESFSESHLYSDPAAWAALPPRQRRATVARTDRGVFSVAVQAVLDTADSVSTVAGRVTRLTPTPGGIVVRLDDGGDVTDVSYPLVVDATGFDPTGLLQLLGPAARGLLAAATGARAELPTTAELEGAIGPDLAVPGLVPRLHLPVLAGYAQGPGFANLSCLGLLADRVLGAHAAGRAHDGAAHGHVHGRAGADGGRRPA